jgi:long-chain acyl-CoA synthetase
VKLTHRNFTSLVAALSSVFPLGAGDAVVSVLPLHHTFEFTCGLLLPLSRGSRIVYVGEINGDRIAEALRMSRATAMIGVPALWQRLERRILQRVETRGPLARATFDWALEINQWLAGHVGVDLGRVLFGTVHTQMGGRLRWLVSGGSALPPETQDTFAGLGLPLVQGYGLTEAAPVLTVSRPGGPAERGVGRPVQGVEVDIRDPDANGIGEIVARGPNVMLGYTDDSATRQAIDASGWLRTGDLGSIDRKGRVHLVGRLKDVVVLATGENVYPDEIEGRLGTVPGIAELAVVGIPMAGGERLACLAVPAAPTISQPRADDDFDRARAALRQAMEDLSSGHRPGIVELYGGPLPRTSTGKVKRAEVAALLSDLLARSRDGSPAQVTRVRGVIALVRGIRAADVHAQATVQGELGFDSMMLVELHEHLERAFGPIDRERLGRCATVAEIEGLVQKAEMSDPTPDSSEPSPPALLLPKPVQALGRAAVGKVQDAFYGFAMKAHVVGRANIPHNRNVIVVANHSSHLDMGLVRHALGKYGEDIVSLAAQDYFFADGLRRAFFENLTNLQPLDRRTSLRQAMRQAGEVVERGKTVLVFPEGTRSPNGEIQEFKAMVGSLALTHRVDILPIFLGGTHQAMGKGALLPTHRELLARIGPPLGVGDLARLTEGMAPARAAREVARMARAAVMALRDGRILDLAATQAGPDEEQEHEHPLVRLFAELEAKFRAGEVKQPLSYYVTLGSDDLAKWTVRVDAHGCHVRPGRPDGGQADCVLKTSPELFAKIVRESYVPSPTDFLTGLIKSNDVALLMTFQRVFQLDQAS